MAAVRVYPPPSIKATVTIDGVPRTITVSPTAVPDARMRADVDAAQAAADAAQADVDALAGTVAAISIASLGGDAAGTPRPPTGAAGGALSGTYPSPGLADGVVTLAKIAAALQDPAAATAGLRTLGTGPAQAAAGDHAHDARYLRLAGGTLTGSITIVSGGNLQGSYYTPSVLSLGTFDSIAPSLATYIQVGPVVYVSGFLALSAPSSGLMTGIISIPVPSNFVAASDGRGMVNDTTSGRINDGDTSAESATDAMLVRAQFSSSGTAFANFNFQYRVI